MTRSSYAWRVCGILCAAALTAAGLFSFPPMAQDPAYHDFADKRTLLGIPNFGDVVSNLPFLAVGLMGLRFLKTNWNGGALFVEGPEKRLWLALFGSVALVSVGSGYYHLEPDNARLAWDRITIVMAFMSLFSIVAGERIHGKAGLYLLPPLLCAGITSVVYWSYTELRGLGDLRPYALAQFLPMLAIPMMCLLFPPRYTGTRYLVLALVWYALAKVFEHFDKGLFEMLRGIVSGHTLKHLAAGFGAYALLRYLQKRRTWFHS
ncbi:MAG: alkaline phytoceramidase [Nitrospinae bacterium]|nr:alkaline phytoceramidase [Nitrospinota bacterium]